MMGKFIQGRFKPENPEKYKGNVKDIIYRSSWELIFLRRLDLDKNVIEYSSEEVIIPYYFITNKVRRYFMDFYVKRKIGDKIVEQLIEIKPYNQTIPPVITEEKKKKTSIKQVMTYEMNQAKWKAAKKYCEKKNWDFIIITEKELGIKG